MLAELSYFSVYPFPLAPVSWAFVLYMFPEIPTIKFILVRAASHVLFISEKCLVYYDGSTFYIGHSEDKHRCTLSSSVQNIRLPSDRPGLLQARCGLGTGPRANPRRQSVLSHLGAASVTDLPTHVMAVQTDL